MRGRGDCNRADIFEKRALIIAREPVDGVRLATLAAGMAFGEMALLETHRSADVFADRAATAYDISLAGFERFRDRHPKASERIMRNLAQLLADRLIAANTRLDLLTAG